MKRIYRQLNDATKQRISQRLKGRTMTDTHKEAISQSMKAYWETIPNKPLENNSNNSKNIKNHEKNMQKEYSD